MSLSGNLQALSLPELLQIVSLSRKNGTLEICSDQGVAWLGLQDGGVVRVALDSEDLERAVVLKQHGIDAEVDAERAESVLWDTAVHAILRIFDWHTGEFTFQSADEGDAEWRGPEGLTLPAPLAPEFLALEGARLEDEARSGAPASEDPAAQAVDPAMDWSDLNDSDGEPAAPASVASVPGPPEAPQVPAPRVAPPVIICIDPDLPLLERVKVTLARDSTRVHIFQDPGDALRRLKQYIVNGSFPVLVMASTVEDPLDARRGLGWRRFVARIRSLAPTLRVVLMREGEDGADTNLEQVAKPDPRFATEPDVRDFLSQLAQVLGLDA